ncbi:MAG: alpha-ketoglutarate-dependent dioxygenase AlkB [Rhodospirillaceae bacterium]|nr:alpha-ketoglutarate-dependent dioxygenase AlkB [Rhodospirillaceae bacterium]OUT80628.1 MAG: alpha-ketoglutarate-dependent dioxygenase AlkB [Rhodospirillaceae bacterium TMED23]|tara:strand:- start:1475 stop:2086 length:612 start_codon:yes stop_codon:yes gene_type:complete
MDLFDNINKIPQNLLSHDGIVLYYGPIIPHNVANNYFNTLMREVAWEPDRAVIFGKTIITKRKVAWYADKSFSYTYSKTTKKALPWTKTLLQLKVIAERESGEIYNSCLLNLYHDGNQGMSWHSDGEKDLQKNGAIGSISLGAERKFAFKNKKTKEVITKNLEHGSLLVMKGTTQTHWLHRLPPTRIVDNPRINLTFRKIATG